MKIAVMGAGGVGGYFGGLLARAGHSVTFVARGAHLAAIQAEGLRIESSNDGNFTVPGTALEDTSNAGQQELVLFTVKMYHNSSAIQTIRPLVGQDTVVLTLQNEIDNGEQLAAAFGRARVMIGSAYLEGRIKEPGLVTQGGPGNVTFGKLEPGLTERGERLLKVFQEAGWRVPRRKTCRVCSGRSSPTWPVRPRSAPPAEPTTEKCAPSRRRERPFVGPLRKRWRWAGHRAHR